MNARPLLIALAGLGLGLVLSACPGSEPNPTHCFHAMGDATCVERFGDARPFCAAECGVGYEENYGCVEAMPSDPACYSPCGGDQNATEDASCLGSDTTSETSESESSTTNTTTETSETGPGPCTMDEECGGATPFCGPDGECVDCSGMMDPSAACTSANPDLAVCVDGECVECGPGQTSACIGTTPVCDETTFTCVGCSDHEQCPDSACNLVEGNCMDESAVIHVDGDGVADYDDLTTALTDQAGVPELTIILHELAGLSYQESVVVDGVTVAILAAQGESPVLVGTGGNPGFTVTADARLYMRGVSASETPMGGRGLEVDGGQAYLQQCRVVNNGGGGISVTAGGHLVLENSYVGGDVSDRVALAMDGGTLEASYVTFAAGFGNSAALTCADGAGKSVRNSLLVSRSGNPELACPNLTITTSALEAMVGDNVALGDVNVMWFVDFASGNFGLNAAMVPAIVATAATWQAGDPTTDIDGDARPDVAGSPDYAGADIP